MRTNGQLQIETRTEGGLNQWGEPIGDAVAWSEPIPCLAKATVDTRLGRYDDGEFRQASYTVLVEGEHLQAERIRLAIGGETVGEFRIISISRLTLGRVQIIV